MIILEYRRIPYGQRSESLVQIIGITNYREYRIKKNWIKSETNMYEHIKHVSLSRE